MSGIETALAALYLRGIPRPAEPHPRAWPEVLSLLRRESGDCGEVLRTAGFMLEASVVQSRAFEHADRLVESGLALTVASPHYPRKWVERLSQGAPAALYARGSIELLASDSFAVVGSRRPPPSALRAAIDTVFTAAELGYVPLSGGAPGVDRTVSAAGPFIEIWPCGLGLHWGAKRRTDFPSLQLSLWPPRELFSTAGAMERNSLVYALSEAAFVGHARFRQGGSWHGATDALRRRLTRILVTQTPWDGESEDARRALLALGAHQLSGNSREALSAAIQAPPLQPWLPVFAPDPTARPSSRGLLTDVDSARVVVSEVESRR